MTTTGTPPQLAQRIVTLATSGAIALDASLGDIFDIVLSASSSLAAPTKPTDGQRILLRVKQGGAGSYTLTLNAIFRFKSGDSAPTLSTTVGAVDYFGFVYNLAANKWDVLAYQVGYGA